MHNIGPSDDGHPVGGAADEVACQQFVELVTDYFEGALPPRTLSHVEEHLVVCDWRVTYVEQMRATVDSIRKLKVRASRDPSDVLLAALRANESAGR